MISLCVCGHKYIRGKGAAILGLILAIFIIALLVYGSTFLWRRSEAGDRSNYSDIKSDLNDIQKQNDDLNKQKIDAINEIEKSTSTQK
jgi:uncharacterized protein YxeA